MQNKQVPISKTKAYHKEKSHEWYLKNKAKVLEQSRNWKENNKGKRAKYMKIWADRNREKVRETSRKSYLKRKKKLLIMISNGNLKCVNCGCNDIRLLEINHKNGGGSVERKRTGCLNLYEQIRRGERGIKDLELLCRVCNAQHYLESKFGRLPFKIKWLK